MRNEQLGLFMREQGLDSVEYHNMNWVERMRERARKLSIQHGSVCADDLRLIANKTHDNPEHVNAWGAVFRGKDWMVIGRKRSETPTAHAREIKVWQYKGNNMKVEKHGTG